MTPPDGRDVAEAVVERLAKIADQPYEMLQSPSFKMMSLYGEPYAGTAERFAADLRILIARARATPPQKHDQGGGDVEARELTPAQAVEKAYYDGFVERARHEGDWPEQYDYAAVMSRDYALDFALSPSPTPATAGEPSTAEEVLGEGPAFWLNVKREPAGESSPSLREAIKACITDMLCGNYASMSYAAKRARLDHAADAILALPSAPASSVEGGGSDYYANLPCDICDTRHGHHKNCPCNAANLLDASPHQPEGGDNGRG